MDRESPHATGEQNTIHYSRPDPFDVVVVGAGFGGPVAARKCAEAGLKVLLLERGKEPGDKVISGLTIPFYGFLFGPDFIRDGNPPIERPVDGIINFIVKDIGKGDIDIDDSLRIPKPLSPVVAFGYNAYCKPFCSWLADRAVEAGAELRTSTAATDLIRENGTVAGVVTDRGERIHASLVIDAEGMQGLLAVRAGVRDKYPPDTISLADCYDYEMSKEEIDHIFGHTLRFAWGWDEQRIAPPLGQGNGLMVWPYRRSIHWIQDQCLKLENQEVPRKRDFDEYHRNITSGLPWWRDEVAPHTRLRARIWDVFEIFVGLNDSLRNMPNLTDGMMLIGDAAGLESTELCDGVPAAWFSAEIAAEVAIEAVRTGDTSVRFLRRYNQRIREHPLIQWSITARNRYDLREAQRRHDEALLKQLVHNGWGLGGFTHMSTPLAQMVLDSLAEDPTVITSWLRMFFRYYHNWANERFDGNSVGPSGTHRPGTAGQAVLQSMLGFADHSLKAAAPLIKSAARLMRPLSVLANPAMKLLLPVLERMLAAYRNRLEPRLEPLSARITGFVQSCDPTVFEPPSKEVRRWPGSTTSSPAWNG